MVIICSILQMINLNHEPNGTSKDPAVFADDDVDCVDDDREILELESRPYTSARLE